jgi:polysaccharide export outer membrane protein
MAAGVAGLACILLARASTAQEYRLGPDDVVSITVWERADLTRQVSVRAGGQITFPPVGEVQAAGETTASLARTLEQRLYDFLRRPTQVTVEMVSFLSQRVTIAGAVTTPGRLSFEKIPGLLEVLGSAGGLSSGADLARIQIIRTEGARQTATTVDLAAAMARGDLSDIPALRPGDMVFVPSTAAEATGGTSPAYVLGDVGRAGPVSVGAGLDLLKVLSLAGGTLPTANLGKVQVVGAQPGGEPFVAEVDLDRFLERGTTDFLVRPGDTVRVPSRSRTLLGVWTVTRDVLAVSSTVLNLFLISDVLDENRNINN